MVDVGGVGRARRGGGRRRGDPPDRRPGRRDPGRPPRAADLDRHLAGGRREGGAGRRRGRRQRRLGRRGPRAGRCGRGGRRGIVCTTPAGCRRAPARTASPTTTSSPTSCSGRRRWRRPPWQRASSASGCSSTRATTSARTPGTRWRPPAGWTSWSRPAGRCSWRCPNKDFVGETLDVPLEERLTGTLAATAVSAWLGARVFRAHDVAATRQTLDMVASIRGDRLLARTVRGLA